MHEKEEGTFTFSGFSDVVSFIQLAQEVGLYVILRPTPYICAEWEFGGLPAWLLEKNCRIRSSDPVFLTYVRRYYEELLEKVVPLQVTHGGPILMMQIENEYGSYREDKDYLKAIKQINEVIIFETEGKFAETLRFTKTTQYDLVETFTFI